MKLYLNASADADANADENAEMLTPKFTNDRYNNAC